MEKVDKAFQCTLSLRAAILDSWTTFWFTVGNFWIKDCARNPTFTDAGGRRLFSLPKSNDIFLTTVVLASRTLGLAIRWYSPLNISFNFSCNKAELIICLKDWQKRLQFHWQCSWKFQMYYKDLISRSFFKSLKSQASNFMNFIFCSRLHSQHEEHRNVTVTS